MEREAGRRGIVSRATILVGIDGSAASLAALRWAAAEGRRRGARVLAVHAWEWSGGLHAPYAPSAGRASREEERKAALMLARRVVAELGADHVEPLVLEGPPAQVLIRASAGADLLVLGARHCRSGPYPSIDPVIAACLQGAHCPVVIPPARGAGDRAAARALARSRCSPPP
ncbi:MAG: universal stress protein, partial [Thermobispora bispora]|nr:universal stress protein [Thermobispora bispora]